jgi:DNA sulfur modification protein DndE
MSLEHIKLSQQAKDHLARLKRFTGIENWNVLCRWALCVSLAEKTVPPLTKITTDSSVEMSWKVFGGKHADVYLAALKQRCIDDGMNPDEETLTVQFRLHLHRGIGYLASDKRLRTISQLIAKLPEH